MYFGWIKRLSFKTYGAIRFFSRRDYTACFYLVACPCRKTWMISETCPLSPTRWLTNSFLKDSCDLSAQQLGGDLILLLVMGENHEVTNASIYTNTCGLVRDWQIIELTIPWISTDGDISKYGSCPPNCFWNIEYSYTTWRLLLISSMRKTKSYRYAHSLFTFEVLTSLNCICSYLITFSIYHAG